MFRVVSSADVEIQKTIPAKLLKGGSYSIFPEGISGIPDKICYAAGVALHFRNGDRPVRVLERVSPGNNGVEDTEYRSIGTDAQGQHHSPDCSEAGISPQHMKAMAKVLQKLF